MARVIREHRGIMFLTVLLIGMGIAASCFMDIGGGGGGPPNCRGAKSADHPG